MSGTISANTGFAPSRHTALAVAKNVKLGTITSSPGPMPSASSASSSASLPDAQPIACFGAAILGHRRFELRTRRTVHKRARPRNLRHRGFDFGLQPLVLAIDIEHRDTN